ncbi:hypothetical protein CONPUDRAFT_145906 [Coniophora puteana RWD-64-598 SS2]|uniref:DUF6533 domain-containing protein n=1 Tax=Coniophora puteana (strain RWD-64-598) TaxID=741705 RepID=A0A5M3MF63_CONPW|nr:uncharacterized protein CONPUDRAFT_145906 [Coniophora puteana RWD-64-598 SS2]EIW77646.1 hypothetical protein CONPUDRAFT_145906 [Coniophora puteana RWD-64-598 SS2]
MDALPPYGYTSQASSILSVRYCELVNPTFFLAWLASVSGGITLGFEIILFIMMVYRCLWHLRERRPAGSVYRFKSAAEMLLQQGVLYFVWFAIRQVVAAVARFSSIFSQLGIFIIVDIGWGLQVMLLCMLGPWFILSIRKNHMDSVKGGTDMTMQTLSTIEFRSLDLPADEVDDIMLAQLVQQAEDAVRVTVRDSIPRPAVISTIGSLPSQAIGDWTFRIYVQTQLRRPVRCNYVGIYRNQDLDLTMTFTSNSLNAIPDIITFKQNSYVIVCLAALVVWDHALSLSQEIDFIWASILNLVFQHTSSNRTPHPQKRERSWISCCYVFFLSEPDRGIATLRGLDICTRHNLYLLTVAVNIAESLPPLAYTSQEGILFGTQWCIEFNPTLSIPWLAPTSSALYLGFEIVLFIMMIYRTIWHLWDHRRKGPQIRFQSVACLLLQQGLMYFALFSAWQLIALITLSAGDLTPLKLDILNDIGQCLQTLLLCVLGPWFILSIRKDHVEYEEECTNMMIQTINSLVFQPLNPLLGHSDKVGGVESLGREERECVTV